MTTYDHQLGHFIDMINGAAPRIAAQDAAAQMAAIDALYAAAGMR
jgi:LAS superfamily LD-carboxypeptidase LdcB